MCERLLDIDNGQVFLSGVTVDSAAVYRCNIGFELVGESSRTCQSSGLWSGAEPICTRELLCMLFFLVCGVAHTVRVRAHKIV